MPATTWKGAQIKLLGNNEVNDLIALTEAQRLALIAISDVLGWQTRWYADSRPSDIPAFAGDIQDRLMTTFDICVLVADCIANSQAVRDALAAWANSNGIPVPGAGGGAGGTSIAASGGEFCDLDLLYGQCLALVDAVNTSVMDSFEAFRSAQNGSERMAGAIAMIPGFESLPFDELVALGDWIAEEALEAYEAEWDEALRRELSCRLFCFARDHQCRLTINQYAQILFNEIAQPSLSTWLSLVVGVVGGTFGGDLWVYASHALAVGAIKFLDMTLGQLPSKYILLPIKAADPDNDHLIYCTDCPPPVWCIEFPIDFGKWQPNVAGQAAFCSPYWCSADYFVATNSDNNWTETYIKIQFDIAVQIRSFSMVYDLQKNNNLGSPTTNWVGLQISGTTRAGILRDNAVSGSGMTLDWNGALTANQFGAFVRASRNEFGGSSKILKIRLTGIGDPPKFGGIEVGSPC